MAGIVPLAMTAAHAQFPTSTLKFEVASIRPGCGSPVAAAIDSGGRQTKSAGGGSRGAASSSGRLNECRSLADLIHMACVMYTGGQFHGVWGPQFEAGPPLEGGPAWVRSDTCQVTAKTEGPASRELMSGPMLQALLEDRFALKIHRETRDVPIYLLTVGKGGAKLTPSKPGSCFQSPPRQPGDPAPPIPPGQKPCMNMIGFRKGPNTGLNAQTNTLDEFCVLLSHLLDRPVVNKTGIAGKFDIHLEFAVDESTPRFLPGGDMAQTPVQPSGDPAGPSVFTAVQQNLGLKLDPAKGPGDFLVIDHVERPSAN